MEMNSEEISEFFVVLRIKSKRGREEGRGGGTYPPSPSLKGRGACWRE
jgi:hypothetical protein